MSKIENPLPPCHGQTAKDVKNWLLSNVGIGTVVAIRNTQGWILQYIPAKVVRLGKGRFEVEPLQNSCFSVGEGGNTFYYSGKNCWHPKGQTRLVIPSPAVEANFNRSVSLTFDCQRRFTV